MTSTVTYQLAYRTDMTTTLCAAHAASPRYPLGPVQHGQHDGTCDECERAARRASRILRVVWAVPGVDEGETTTLREAEAALQRTRERVGVIPGYVLICRADGTRTRVSS